MRNFLFIFICFISATVYAKDIKGKITDKDGNAIELANIRIFSLPDSSYIAGTTSNLEGEFFFNGIKVKRAYVLVSSIGYKECKMEVPLDKEICHVTLEQMSVNLNEVVIKGNNRYIDGEKVIFMPSKRDKDISAEGFELLKNMSLPLIKVSLLDNSVKTVTGDEVSFYVDYHQATSKEISGLQTSDVLRVEYLDSPSDPRFNGDKRVVHFIMKKYEYGGYTKLRIGQGFINNMGDYGLNSKFVHKSMTYDLSSGLQYAKDKHVGTREYSLYNFGDTQIERSSNATNGKKNTNSFYTTLRALYQTDKCLITNTFGIQTDRTPKDDYSASVEYTPAIFDKSISDKKGNSKLISPTWNGKYDFYLKDKSVVSISPSLAYSHSNNDYLYQSDVTDIHNTTEENALEALLNFSYAKSFGKHNASFYACEGYNNNVVEYGGDTNYKTTYRNLFSTIRGIYTFKSGIFNLYASCKYSFSTKKLNEKRYNECLPQVFINSTTSFNKHHQLKLSTNIAYFSSDVSSRTNNTIRQNEIDAIAGNPDLKSYFFYNIHGLYLWIPNNVISIIPYCIFNNWNKPVTYLWNAGGDSESGYTMTRTYQNSGSFSELNYGCSIELNLFENKLSASVSGDFETYNRSGIYSFNKTEFYVGCELSYKISNFIFSASYDTSKKTARIFGYDHKELGTHMFMAGWGRSGLNVSLRLQNIFNSSYRGDETMYMRDAFSRSHINYYMTYHRSVMLTLSYSIGYGKKVNQTDGPGKTSTTKSTILK
jgi:hypothetical protein